MERLKAWYIKKREMIIIQYHLRWVFRNQKQEFKQWLIARAMSTPEGRLQLAKAMVEPIRNAVIAAEMANAKWGNFDITTIMCARSLRT